MTRIGVVGTGYLGRRHVNVLRDLPALQLAGVYDIDATARDAVAQEYGVPAFDSYEALLAACDAVDIVTPTTTHFELAAQAVRAGKHIFIEKPLARTLDEARALEQLVAEAQVTAQVGHIERFNPAFLAATREPAAPMFIEAHRLAQWNPRGTDVSVVQDLMIHDIDVVLKLAQSTVKRISASGVPVISDTPDICNARIEFANGCVANLTASRISAKNMRRMRLFQPHAYLTIDFLEKKAERFRIQEGAAAEGAGLNFEVNGKTKSLGYEAFPVDATANALAMELTAFADAIGRGVDPPVTLHDGYMALYVALEVSDKLNAPV